MEYLFSKYEALGPISNIKKKRERKKKDIAGPVVWYVVAHM